MGNSISFMYEKPSSERGALNNRKSKTETLVTDNVQGPTCRMLLFIFFITHIVWFLSYFLSASKQAFYVLLCNAGAGTLGNTFQQTSCWTLLAEGPWRRPNASGEEGALFPANAQQCLFTLRVEVCSSRSSVLVQFSCIPRTSPLISLQKEKLHPVLSLFLRNLASTGPFLQVCKV